MSRAGTRETEFNERDGGKNWSREKILDDQGIVISSPEPSGSQGELIVYPCSVVRPSSVRRPSSTIFKDLLL